MHRWYVQPASVYACMHVGMPVCLYACMPVCLYACMLVCIYAVCVFAQSHSLTSRLLLLHRIHLSFIHKQTPHTLIVVWPLIRRASMGLRGGVAASVAVAGSAGLRGLISEYAFSTLNKTQHTATKQHESKYAFSTFSSPHHDVPGVCAQMCNQEVMTS